MTMDFAAALTPVNFTSKPAGENIPRPFHRRQPGTRRFAQLKAAQAILSALPAPGESLHCLQSARYDLADVIGVLLGKLGPVDHLALSTLSFHRRNSEALLSWIDAGLVARLTMVCSVFFREHFAETFDAIHQALKPPHRIAATRTHAKLICMHFTSGRKMVIEGSANLRSNGNAEQYTLVNDAQLCDFWTNWISGEVSHGTIK
jgi:hypothetical protein